ncbi:MAG: hypothetical protein JSV18_08265 [Candidatus Bathyarchaeota archaeon]|nr:MAG: hypothetical protein JSV18_08265 [Candidatus Bathyarchaeota archaeon]
MIFTDRDRQSRLIATIISETSVGRGKGVTMIILLYFDWIGSCKELKDWEDKIAESCSRTGVEYRGLYGSMNEKWNFVSVFETDGYDRFLEMGRKVVRHVKMPHHITELLLPQKL